MANPSVFGIGHSAWDPFWHELFAIPIPRFRSWLLATGLVALGALIVADVVALGPRRAGAESPELAQLRT